MKFKDRTDVGEQLADALAEYKSHDCIVYALPRGGVVPAAIVARQLAAPLDLLITRKIGHPYQPEYAVAAVAEDGTVVSNQHELGSIDEDWLAAEVTRQQTEAKRRRAVYLHGSTSLSARGKTAIIVDDGIATGLTMKAAIKELRKQQPATIVVAIPVAPSEVIAELKTDVDDVISLTKPGVFAGSIGAYYEQFDQVTDEEVITLLDEAQRS